MLQAMNTGHDGSLTTVHANSPRDALARIEKMVLMAGWTCPSGPSGSRSPRRSTWSSTWSACMTAPAASRGHEVNGMEGETVTMQDAFVFDYSAGVDVNGRFLGKPVPTGVRPRFTYRFAELGHQLCLPEFSGC